MHVLPEAHPLGGTERTVLDLLESPQLADLDQRVAFAGRVQNREFPPEAVLAPRGTGAGALAVAGMRPAVVHGWLLRGNLAGGLAKARRPSTPLVTSERNLGHTLTPAKRALERVVAAVEDVATANSAAVRDAAVARLPRREKTFRVILPGVAAPPQPARLQPSDCLMVGRLHPVKDHATALRAWALVRERLPGAVLAVVGEGPERPSLEALGRELDLGEGLRLVGGAEPAPWLHGARTFLSASSAEGFSRSLLEALACGLPSVATAVGGTRELPAGAVRSVPPGEPRAMADALLVLLEEGTARDRAAAAARGAAEALSPSACHASYRALYAELGA